MMVDRAAILVLLAVLAVSASGCKVFGGKPKTPVAPAARPVSTPTPARVPVAPAPHKPKPVIAPPPAPAPTTSPAPAPSPAPVPTPSPAPPPPAFGQILTPQQQAGFQKSDQQSSQSARQVLSQISGRALTRDQADTANRIRSFLRHTHEAQ